MKLIAFYLPQFHNIPENDEWWGSGFTEWTNVRKAKPLFLGHSQPRVPLNKNYYNLLDEETQIWQANIAKQHGIYGFCYYHYWFSGKLLLEKPMENMLQNPKIDFPFCICWANEPWTKAWIGETKVLIPQKYGTVQDWTAHFNYLLPFFKDKRYITEDGKPLIVIYRPEVIVCLNDMLDHWDALAKKNGLCGLSFAYQNIDFDLQANKDDSRFSYNIEFQPLYAKHDLYKDRFRFVKKVRRNIANFVEKKFGIDLMKYGAGALNSNIMSFDEAWKVILKRKPDSDKNIPGAFVGWDNSPRKGEKGLIYTNDNPNSFKQYLEKLIVKAREEYKKDYIFVFAWNEWAEGGYLEPDERFGYQNLEAIKSALIATGEYPWEIQQDSLE